VEIRPLTADDLPFLRRMLDAAAFWRPMPTSPLPRLRQLVLRPILRMLVRNYLGLYHRDWGRPGDVGVIGEIDGRPVGAAWYRLFTEASHGDGYIDERTPELAIAVENGYRGRGVGRALLLRIEEQARADGLERIGLSVDADNPARKLYESVAYRELGPHDPEGRMVLDLNRLEADS
jgi:GNAT superfamily N-acetyltransferase